MSLVSKPVLNFIKDGLNCILMFYKNKVMHAKETLIDEVCLLESFIDITAARDIALSLMVPFTIFIWESFDSKTSGS